jgi:hypothetical protein
MGEAAMLLIQTTLEHTRGLRRLCRVAVIVFEQPTEPLPTVQKASTLWGVVRHRYEHDIALALMGTLGVIMAYVFA